MCFARAKSLLHGTPLQYTKREVYFQWQRIQSLRLKMLLTVLRWKPLLRKVYKYIKENSGMPILSQILATDKITVLAFKNIKNNKSDT